MTTPTHRTEIMEERANRDAFHLCIVILAVVALGLAVLGIAAWNSRFMLMPIVPKSSTSFRSSASSLSFRPSPSSPSFLSFLSFRSSPSFLSFRSSASSKSSDHLGVTRKAVVAFTPNDRPAPLGVAAPGSPIGSSTTDARATSRRAHA